MSMESEYVYALIAEAVVAEGAEVVFAVMGDGNMKFLGSLEAAGSVRVVYCRHEGAAAAAAEGYARATGRLGFCSVTCGPGLTLTATTLVIASRNRTPFVLIAGDAPLLDRFYNQSIDQRRFVEASECVLQQIRTPGTADEDLRAAFSSARAGQPVVISAPFDMQNEPLPGETTRYRPSSELVAAQQPIVPDAGALDRAVSLISAAKRPLVIAGRGALGAREEIEELSDRTGALLATTLMSKALFNGHPRNIGLAGNLGTQRTRALIEAADCVVAIGSSLNQYTTNKGKLLAGAAIVHVSTEPRELVFGRRLPVHALAGPASADCYVQGDARITTRLLNERLHRDSTTSWDDVLDSLVVPDPGTRQPTTNDGAIHPRDAMLALDHAALDETKFVIGLGHFWWFATTFLTGRDASSFQYTTEFGAIGQGFPSAIGTAIAAAPRPVLLVEGDASMMMSIQELDTAVRYGVDLVVVVMDDGGLAAEFHKLDAWQWDSDSARIPSPDFAGVAASFGARSARVDDVSELPATVREMQAGRGPALIDVRISPEIVSDQYWDAHFAVRETTR